MKVSDLNTLEREYLACLQFTVSLTASLYAKYYFDLRALSDRTEDHFPLKPLDAKGVQRLEAKSRGLEEIDRIFQSPQRANSLDVLYQSNSQASKEQVQLKCKHDKM